MYTALRGAFFFVWAWVMAGATAGASQDPTRATPVWIAHTGDILGEIEPCGCRSNPLGGFLRQWQWMQSLRAEKPRPEVWLVDAGDLLFSTAEIVPLLKDQSRLQASYVLKAVGLLGVRALVPGEKDFALGLPLFQKLVKEAGGDKKLPYVAANITLRATGKPLFPPFRVERTPEGKRIAFVGVVSELLNWPKELNVASATETLRTLIPEVRQKAELVVLISHQGLEADQELAKRVSGIDWIIGAHTQAFLQEPIQEGKTWIFQTSFRNQWVGYAPVEFPWDPAHYKMIGLDTLFDPLDGAKPTPMSRLVDEAKAAIAKKNLEKDTRADRTASGAADRAAAGKYQTFPSCAECHLQQTVFWSRTRHARALEPLIASNQAANLECLQCHTTGLPNAWKNPSQLTTLKTGETLTLEQTQTFLKQVRTGAWDKPEFKLLPTDTESSPLHRQLARVEKAWAPVQCENCHGAMGEHPFSGQKARASVKKELCIQCHVPERSPTWYVTKGKPGAGKPDWDLVATKLRAVQCPRR